MGRPTTPPQANSNGDGPANERQEFGRIVRDLLIERGYTTPIGNPDWARFARDIDVNYETLRKAVTRERVPSVKLMERVGAQLGVEPMIFWEFELARARQSFDVRHVGDEEAFANLQRWLAS
jgi:hypothetical protein